MKFHKQPNSIGQDKPQDLMSEGQVFWCGVGFSSVFVFLVLRT